jgi:UDP-N-acetylglucosamine 2-epimerase (non-hydrolysing)
MHSLKILNIVGARPNLPKIAPLLSEMREHPEIAAILVHTGQHYDESLSDIFFRQMGIPAPHVNLEVGSGSHASQTAEILKRVEPVLEEHQPDVVLVVGDATSIFCAYSAKRRWCSPIPAASRRRPRRSVFLV